MGNYATYVGMDVHARSVTAKALVCETGEYFHKMFSNHPTAADVAEWLTTLPQPVYCAYESGCTGFWMARDLTSMGFDCDVIAVSTLPRSTKDKQQKCDKLDAKTILREIVNPASTYTVVWVPDAATEAKRNLVRVHQVAKDNLKHARQRLISFLLTYGYVWNEKTKTGKLKKTWGRDFTHWLDEIVLSEPVAQRALEAYRRQVRNAEQEAKETKILVEQLASEPENKPFVDAFRCMKGIDTTAAMLLCAEFGEFERFDTGRKVSCWAGTVPANSSSGEHETHGKITKAGNKYTRRILIEGLSGISTWKSGRKAIPKDVIVSAAIQALSYKGNARLYKRYKHLREDNGLHSNKAKVAVANELIRWVWVIGVQIQHEMQKI